MSRPVTIAFYKGLGKNPYGAVQFDLKRPSVPEGKQYPEEGVVFLNITSSSGGNIYDWENKIVMALNVNDISQLNMLFEGRLSEVKLFHDPGAGTQSKGQVKKQLYVSAPKGISEGAMLTASQDKNGKQVQHKVPLSGSEVNTLAVLFRAAIPAMLGWS